MDLSWKDFCTYVHILNGPIILLVVFLFGFYIEVNLALMMFSNLLLLCFGKIKLQRIFLCSEESVKFFVPSRFHGVIGFCHFMSFDVFNGQRISRLFCCGPLVSPDTSSLTSYAPWPSHPHLLTGICIYAVSLLTSRLFPLAYVISSTCKYHIPTLTCQSSFTFMPWL